VSELPVIDVGPLVGGGGGGDDRRAVAYRLDAVCREVGFFYVVGHGVDEALIARLDRLSREFFARTDEAKSAIRMELGGRAWRGWFPVGGELTAGRPDLKEGLYFGTELPPEHPLVRAGTPLHGPNLFPGDLPGYRETVLAYMDALTGLGRRVMAGLAMGLGLPGTAFDRFLAEPTTLFRIFHYPPDPEPVDDRWGVGEHTDYGVLTILKQDDVGGLQVRTRSGWVDAPPVPGSFVCNIGDMLELLTRGRYVSTAHRVRNLTGEERLSFPFFLDPGFGVELDPVELAPLDMPGGPGAPVERWDGARLDEVRGTYGEYLLAKVGKVFPGLREATLD
jgi:isopenicillin N synthase-like dioxygenase